MQRQKLWSETDILGIKIVFRIVFVIGTDWATEETMFVFRHGHYRGKNGEGPSFFFFFFFFFGFYPVFFL
jgi:hypothetical protein